MDSRHQPLRQCIGCRKVRQKKELLRFVKILSAEPVFDSGNEIQGRGFYLCPDERCFTEAYRNRRIRNTYFRGREQIDELIREVQEALLKMIEQDIIRCKYMGYLQDSRSEAKTIREDDLVLFSCDNPPEEKVRMHTAARTGGARFILLPAEYGHRNQCLIVNRECPFVSRLARNLQKYEVLSSKGLAI